jgi:Spx/MgsR family transcriptional regulator
MTRAAQPVVYGITNCDTVRRARGWLEDRLLGYRFHDFKKDGVSADRIDAWIGALDWERLVNRSATSWRRLDEDLRRAVIDAASARALMLAQPSVIRRPVVEWPGGRISVGFDALDWVAWVAGAAR